MAMEAIPFIAVPCGWMPCVACKDFKTQPGKMWLGYERYTGADLVITCPVCKGAGQVPRLKHIDIRTGKEIDYEKPGQKFVYQGTSDKAVAEQPRDRIIVT